MSEGVGEGLLDGVEHGQKVIMGIGVADIGAAMQKFGLTDYIVFVCMLLICIGIGIYFGFFEKAQNSQDYLVGGRNMRVFPVSMSLIASFISGISLLGIPTEIYVYGIQYMYISGGVIGMGFLMVKLFLPVFYDLKLTSLYEYLDMRFDRRVRILGSILFAIGLITWLPVVIYVPALAFNQVTGVNVHYITPTVCVICTFYTCVGGIKAVVWTDVIQTIVMYGAMLLVIVKGSLDVGGVGVVWQRNWDSERIEGPNWDINPLSRHTVWALVIGGSIYWLQSASINQSMLQRYLALPSLTASKRSIVVFVVGILILTSLCAYSGMLIFAKYSTCDPITTKLAREKDQLLPLLVMDVLGDFPGLPGLFVAGIFSAALSSLSTGLNSMAAVVLEDFVKPCSTAELSEKTIGYVMRGVVVVFGFICVALVFIVEKMGTVLQLTMGIGAIGNGPSLGLVVMGTLLPWITAEGAFFGTAISLGFMGWLCLSAQAAIASGDLYFPEKNVSTDGCHYHFVPRAPPPSMSLRLVTPLNTTDVHHTDEIFMMYRLSYLWYTLIGTAISIVASLIISYACGMNSPSDVDPRLLSPAIRSLVPKRHFPNQPASPDALINAYEETKNPLAQIPLEGMQQPKVV